jgi:hypothetical protein
MTKREFRRLKAGNLVQEALSQSLWVVVERRRRTRPCLILARARLVRGGMTSGARLPDSSYTWQEDAWTVVEDYSATLRRLA